MKINGMTRYCTYIAFSVLIVLCGLAGCKKDKDIIIPAEIITGSITGTVSPATAVKSIVAVPASASAGTTQAKLDSSNRFSIANLRPGNYKIGFDVMPGFIAPDTVSVTVAAGKNADIGTITFKPSATTPTASGITGKISPDTAVVNITATDSSGHVRYVATTDTAGNFKIDNVLPGSYELSFAPPLHFAIPENIITTVIAGNISDVGTIVLLPDGPAFLSFSLYDGFGTDTFNYSPPDVNCTYINNQLIITTAKAAAPPYWYFTFNITGFSGVGTYNLNYLNRTSYAMAYDVSSPQYTYTYTTQKYNTDRLGSSGSVAFTVTAFDDNKHIVAGTFSGRLVMTGISNSTIGISNGSFKLTY